MRKPRPPVTAMTKEDWVRVLDALRAYGHNAEYVCTLERLEQYLRNEGAKHEDD